MPLRFPRRFNIILPWLKARRQGRCRDVSVGQLLRYLTMPTMRQRGMRFVTSLDDSGDQLAVRLRGYDRPIYWPKDWGQDTLGMLISEQFDPTDWHYYQIPETRLEPDDVVLDCGAAEGLFTLIAAGQCRRVYAFEPLPRFCDNMRRSFAGLDQVVIVPALLSNRQGEARLQAQGIVSAESGDGGVACRVDTLDYLFPDGGERVTYLKADVEGAELELLEGARGLITRDKPKIAITTYHHPDHADEIARLLREINPAYHLRTKGICERACPMMLHAW